MVKKMIKKSFVLRKIFEKPHCRAKLGEKQKKQISENQLICFILIYFNIFAYILIHFYIKSIENHIKLCKFDKNCVKMLGNAWDGMVLWVFVKPGCESGHCLRL